MKLNKKIIVPALSLLAGASLLGSVTGTIAWYQYSTRANVSYIGSSAGTIGNLQIRLANGEWKTQISIQDVDDYLSAQNIGQKVEPITSGPMAKNDSLKKGKWQEVSDFTSGDTLPTGDTGHAYFIKTDTHELYEYDANGDAWNLSSIDAAAVAPSVDSASSGDKYFNTAQDKLFEKVLEEKDFYLNPVLGHGPYDQWLTASEENFVKLPLQLRFMEENEEHLNAEDVYLSKLVIKEDRLNDSVSAHGDISDAIRVHFSAYEDGDEDNAINHLVSNKGGTTLTHGKLKIGNGDDFDKAYQGDEFGFDGSDYDYVNYGGTSGDQNSYGNLVDSKTGYYYEEEKPASGWIEVSLTSGLAAPDNNDGQDGDFYYKTDTQMLYVKNVGAWGLCDNYFIGSVAPTPETANPNNYDYYVLDGLNKLFLRDLPTEETIYPILVENVENSLQLNKVTADKKIGTTVATRANNSEPQKYLNVDVTIWVEGWQKFDRDGQFTSIWNRDLIGAMFDVGFQFAVQDR